MAQTTIVNYNFNSGTNYTSLNGGNINAISSAIYCDTAYSTTTGTITGDSAFTANSSSGSALVFDQLTTGNELIFDLKLSGAALSSFKDFKLYFQARRTTTGLANLEVLYSTDSLNFNTINNINIAARTANQFNEFFNDYSSVTGLNNQSQLFLRFKFTGASSLLGTLRLDNLQIQASCDTLNEPTVNTDSLIVSSTSCQTINLSWKKGNGNKTLIIAKTINSTINSTPTDAFSYNASSVFGSGSVLAAGEFVVYADTGNSVTISGLNQNTNYYFKAFSFNDNDICPTSANYLTNGSTVTTSGLTTNCFDILSILVHACGQPESYNEMFRFKTKNEAVNIYDLEVGGSTNNTPIVWGKWPNNNLNFNGFYQSNYTAIKTDSINNTITSCGILIEPPLGIIPPNSEVIVFTDTMIDPFANSFAALGDTLYAVYQKFTDFPSQGCFKNSVNGALSNTPNAASTTRNLGLRSISNNALSDEVIYDASLLVNTNFGTTNTQIYGGSSSINRGAAVFYDEAGNASYVNNGCRAPFIPTSVSPVAIVVKPGNVLCTGDSILLQANPSGDYTSLQWSGGMGGTFDVPGVNIDSVWYIASSNDQGNFSFFIEVISACNDTIKDTVNVTVVRPSSVTINHIGDTIFCEGGSVILNAAVLNATSYNWNTGDNSQSITVNTSGTYAVSATNWCNTSSDTIQVVVNPNPSINVLANGPLTFCEGESVILTANTQNTSNIEWSNGYNLNQLTIDSTITIYATAHDTINGCPSATSNTFVITENKYANPNAGLDAEVCSGSGPISIGYTAETGVNYNWSSIPAGFTSTNSQESVNPSSSTTYILEATNNGCVNTDTINITVLNNVNTTIAISTANTTICNGDNVNINSTINGGGTTPDFQWYLNNNPVNLATLNTFNTSTLQNGDVLFCVLTSSLTCSTNSPDTSNYLTFIVNNKPNINVDTIGNTNLCQGETVSFVATGLQSIDTFSWSNGELNDTIILNSTQNISLVANNTCGYDSATVSIIVNPLPSALIIPNGPTTFCNGGNVQLSYSTQSGSTYNWLNGQSGNPITVSNAGWVILSATNNCGTDKDSVEIIINNGTTASITESGNVICNNDSVFLTSSSLNNNLWSTGETSQSIWVNSGGTYTLTVSTPNCGNASASTIINQETVIAQFSTSADTGYIPLEISTINLSSGAANYNWNFGTGAPINTTNATVTYNEAGEFTIILTATGILGCTDTAMKTIRATDPPVTLTLPNIFTPNADGNNDVFKPLNIIGITGGVIEIYNRWGIRIFESSDLSFTWDGKTSSGSAAPDGVYYYIVKAQTKSPKDPEIDLKGYVTLSK